MFHTHIFFGFAHYKEAGECFRLTPFVASHTNTKSPTTTQTAGRMQAEKHRSALAKAARMQAEKHRSALPKAPIQASGALPGHGIAQHQPRLGGHRRRGQQWLCPPV